MALVYNTPTITDGPSGSGPYSGPITFSHDNSGSGCLLVVIGTLRGGATQSTFTATYNSVSMTLIKKRSASFSLYPEAACFILENPAAGSNTVSVTTSASQDSYVIYAIPVDNYQSGDLTGTGDDNVTGDSSSTSLTITTDEDGSDGVLIFVQRRPSTSLPLTPGSGVTELAEDSTGDTTQFNDASLGIFKKTQATAGNVTVDLTSSNSDRRVAFLFELKASAGAIHARSPIDVEVSPEMTSPSGSLVLPSSPLSMGSSSELDTAQGTALRQAQADNMESAFEVGAASVTALLQAGADDLESSSEITGPTGTRNTLTNGDDMSVATEVSAPSVTALLGAGADDLEVSSEITGPTFTREVAAAGNDIEVSSEITSPSVVLDVSVTGENMSIVTEIGSPALTRLRIAIVDAMEAASELTSPAALTGLAALPISMEMSAEIDQVGAVILKAATANDMDVAAELSQAGVTAIFAAVAASMEVATEIDAALYSALQDGNLMRTIELLGEVGGKSKQNFVMVSGDAVRVAVTVTKAGVAQNLTNVTIRAKFFPPRTSVALFEKITGIEVIIDDAANGHFYFDIDKEDTENFRGRLNWVAEGTDTQDQQATFINKSHVRIDPDRIS